MKNLLIVESPGKVKTIQKYLGNDYTVKASIGHIRDLGQKGMGVDIQHGFKPEYEVPADKKKIVAELKKLAAEADMVWLASDEDREGEAISWHLFDTLGLTEDKSKRIVFHEITKDAILNAIKTPRTIDMNLVDAQQARRVLDRLVGFELSPILWRKIQPKLSAGRVQSVALRLIVDREREIMAFKKEPFYRIEATFNPEGTKSSVKVKAVLDNKFDTLQQAEKFLQDSIGARFTIKDIQQKDGVRIPAAPFTTSTLQQEASRKLHLTVSTTMRLAQALYERGLITYMRTDSTNLSSLARSTAKAFICDNFGPEYSRPRQYTTHSKGAQEAHEAIRPTYIQNTSIEGTAQEKKLYDLIWKRTVASQMSDAKILKTDIAVESDRRPELFRIQASQILFDGFLKLYLEGTDDETLDEGSDVILPGLNLGQAMNCKEMRGECKFTQPPFRYSEASLVKKLEELGIGRPSTYSPTITTLTTGRGYVVKGDKPGEKETVVNLKLTGDTITRSTKTEVIGSEKGKLLPQEIGMMVTDYLMKNFDDIINYDFTANVEKDFDLVAAGNRAWNAVIADFYSPFHKKVEDVLSDRTFSRPERELGKDPETGLPVIAKFGQWGPFVQIGEGENRRFAHLAAGQLIENVTLEDALKLFELPRTVGTLDGHDIVATKGKFGPYIKYNGKNFSLPKGCNPLTVTEQECQDIIKSSSDPAKDQLARFESSDITVINGRYGPYIKQNGVNYKIPRGTKAESLTEEKCLEIIKSAGKAKK